MLLNRRSRDLEWHELNSGGGRGDEMGQNLKFGGILPCGLVSGWSGGLVLCC